MSQIRIALRQGISQAEMVELLMQVTVYAGFPAAINALNALAEVLSEPQHAAAPIPDSNEVDTAVERRERGVGTMAKTSAATGEAVVRAFDDLAPDVGRLIVEHAYGEVFSRTGIDPKTRELCAIAALAAVGTSTTAQPLKVHIQAALKAGATRAEIAEVLLNLAPYAGFAKTASALDAVD